MQSSSLLSMEPEDYWRVQNSLIVDTFGLYGSISDYQLFKKDWTSCNELLLTVVLLCFTHEGRLI
jgi:hypothetical protein